MNTQVKIYVILHGGCDGDASVSCVFSTYELAHEWCENYANINELVAVGDWTWNGLHEFVAIEERILDSRFH